MFRRAQCTVAVLITSSILFTGFTPTALASAAPTFMPGIDLPGFGSSDPGGGSVGEAPRLTTVDNFRDVGGTKNGYATAPRGHVARGMFYRSNALSPNGQDLDVLTGLGLSAVYDVRTLEEVASKPDLLPAGSRYVSIPILSGDLSAAVAQLRSPDDAVAFMQDMNRSFVDDEVTRVAFGRLLTELANRDGPQVFHCTAGKDRTGWASALLLSIAGVPQDTIFDDYLLTNEYTSSSMKHTYDQIVASRGEAVAQIYHPLLGVDRSYLEAGLGRLGEKYGTVDRYLTEGLRLSQATIDTLRYKLLD
ncbi:tyrosine-protein phosphatase [Rhodococcus sp. G-MC3]|uniref:tyrosine-protein phosphatase n=1 Tax=Rhodococcus sp. G-MC3 TaxID=3046209 RepID=UPI0030157D36|nr:tyrosine-protein phosphatase [Rhodococcus sp. G-MC3]